VKQEKIDIENAPLNQFLIQDLVDKRTQGYTDIDRDLTEIIVQSYKGVNKRKLFMNVGGVELRYNKELSTSLYSHYENDETIVVGVHGANDIQLNLVAIKSFLKPNKEIEQVEKFCNKYDEVMKSNKKVFFATHSLGGFMVSHCNVNRGGNPTALMLGAYTPGTTFGVNKNIALNPNFKKVLFKNDWLSNNVLKIKASNNVVVFRPSNFFTLSSINGHSLENFRKKNPGIVDRIF